MPEPHPEPHPEPSPGVRVAAPARRRPRGMRSGLSLAVATGLVAVPLLSQVASAAYTGSTSSEANSWSAVATYPTFAETVAAYGATPYHRFEDAPTTAATSTAADSGGTRSSTYDGATRGRSSVVGPVTSEPADRATQLTAADFVTADTVTTLAAGSALTVELWVDGSGTRASLVTLSDTSAGGVTDGSPQLYLNATGQLCWSAAYGGAALGGPRDPRCGATVFTAGWKHVVVTVSPTGGTTVYVNGAMSHSSSSLKSLTGVSNRVWRVGRNAIGSMIDGNASTTTSGGFTGSVDELAVYPVALSQAEVQARYAAATSGSYAATVAAAGPTLFWRLAEPATGVAAAAHGTVAGTYRPVRPFALGQAGALGPAGDAQAGTTAVRLNGVTSIHAATALASPGPQTFTVNLWFRTTTTTGGVLANYGSAQTGSSISVDRIITLGPSGNLGFNTNKGGGTASSNPQGVFAAGPYNDGAWHMVTASCGPAGLKLYVDGVLQQTNTATDGAQAFTGYWRWGGDNGMTWWPEPTTDYFAGWLDEAAVLPTQLTDQQVAWLYGAGV